MQLLQILLAAHPWCVSPIPPHPQKCSTGLRFGDWRPLECSELIVLFKKPIWDYLSSVTWHSSSWEFPSQDGYTVVIKGYGHVEQQYSDRLWHVNDAQLVLSGSKSAKKISPTPLYHHHQPELLIQGRMDPCFHVVYAKFWPYHLNVTAELRLQTRQPFSNLLLSSFGEPVWIVALFSLFLAARSGTLWSSAALAHLLQGSMCCVFRDAIVKYCDQLAVVWLRGA